MYPSIVIVPTQGFCNRLRALASAHLSESLEDQVLRDMGEKRRRVTL